MEPTDALTVPVAPLDRRAAVGTVDAEKRTVELVFSTGADVVRYDWNSGNKYLERLSLDPGHVRLDRLNAGAPLLNAHSAYTLADQIGVVEPDTAKLTKKDARATVRFSKRADVEPFFQDVRDGIIRNVSVGYRVHKFEEQAAGKANEMPVRLATDWEPYEISMVPMGADAGARTRSVKDVDTNPCVIVRAKEEVMAEPVKKTDPTPEVPPAAAPPPDADAIRAAERARITGIQDAVRVAKLEPSVATDLVGRNLTMAEASAEIFRLMVKADEKKPETDNKRGIELGEDARDKFVRGVTNWLLVKSGMAALVARTTKTAPADPGEFRGMTLLEIAKESLVRAGVSIRGLDKMEIAAKAFMLRDVTQSTGDFTYALENTMHKVLQASYDAAEPTWPRFCGRSTVSDFRAHNRYRMGSFGALDAVNENGEFKRKAISDAEKASITATTKGNIISVSRQMIVNDDMGAFSRLLTNLGNAAAQSVEVDVFAMIALNTNLGPTQADAQPLFHANRSNVGSTAAISAAALDADRVIMASQKDPWGNVYLNLRPAVLLVPLSLEGTAKVINTSAYDPDTLANKSFMKPNLAAGFFSDIVGTPRLSGTRRYMFADPGRYPVFEVAFLEGQESPVLESKTGWNTDGTEMKVRFDYGVAATDFRGAVTNAG